MSQSSKPRAVPASQADYARMQQLLVEILARTGPPHYATPGDLDWDLGRIDDPDFLSQVTLWYSDDTFVGFTWPMEGWPYPHFLDMFVHPDHTGLLDAMIAHGEETCRQKGGGTFGLWVNASDTARKKAIEARGYRLDDPEFGDYRLCVLDAEPVVPALAAGYQIALLGDSDVPSRVRAQQSAFDSSLTIAQYERVRRMPTYPSALDLVVKAPNHDVAAFCIVWVDAQNRFAVFEPVGCHKDHQQRGLTKALLQEGLHRLWRLGIKQAAVRGGSHSNPAASALYHSAGLIKVEAIMTYKKVIE